MKLVGNSISLLMMWTMESDNTGKGSNDLPQSPKHNLRLVEAGPQSVDGPEVLNALSVAKEDFQPPAKPTPDCGAFSIKMGDVVMTRAMYYFIMEYVSRLPKVSPKHLERACGELSNMMKELIR